MKVKADHILIACMFQFGLDYYYKCNYSTNSLQMFLKTPVVSELRTCMLCGVIIIRRSSGFRPHNLVYISSTAAPLPLQGFRLSLSSYRCAQIPGQSSNLFQLTVSENGVYAHLKPCRWARCETQQHGGTQHADKWEHRRGPHKVKIPWTNYQWSTPSTGHHLLPFITSQQWHLINPSRVNPFIVSKCLESSCLWKYPNRYIQSVLCSSGHFLMQSI